MFRNRRKLCSQYKCLVSVCLLSPRTFLILSLCSHCEALANLCNSASLFVLWLQSPLLYITCLNSKPSKHRIWLTTLSPLLFLSELFHQTTIYRTGQPMAWIDCLWFKSKPRPISCGCVCSPIPVQLLIETYLLARSSENGKHTEAGVAKSNLYPILKYLVLCLIFLLYIMLKWEE